MEGEMELKVLDYRAHERLHVCEDESGEKFSVDLMVGRKKGTPFLERELIGKTVFCEYILPYSYLAEGTTLEPEKP
jgi:hypothetical protein